MTPEIEFQLKVARAYKNKANNARERDIEFNINFTTMCNIYKAKRCYYTGVNLTNTGLNLPTDITIDRVDSSKGYVKGNVVACSKGFNQIKGWFEDENNKNTSGIGIKELIRSVKKMEKRLGEIK